MRTTEPPPECCDEAVANALRHAFLPGERAAFGVLTALGPPALRRAVELFYGTTASEQPPSVAAVAHARHPREIVDAWSALFGALARTFPDAYLTEITSGRLVVPERLATMEIGILGRIDLPAAAAELHRHSAHEDWLVRLHVVRGLAHRDDARSIGVIDAAVVDDEQLVRDEAARALHARDPEAAVGLYERLAQEVPLHRDELRRRLRTARRLATIRRRRTGPNHPSDPA